MEERKWYVLHALSGQENKALENLKKRIVLDEMLDYMAVEDALIPTETVAETKNGKVKKTVRRLYPGYILVKMSVYDDDRQLMPKPWKFVQDTPGLIGFIGGERPVPLRPEEVAQMMSQIQDSTEKVKPKVVYELGETVRVTDGPFLGQAGIVEKVDEARGKLSVSISIFGQSVMVDLEYWQVERGE